MHEIINECQKNKKIVKILKNGPCNNATNRNNSNATNRVVHAILLDTPKPSPIQSIFVFYAFTVFLVFPFAWLCEESLKMAKLWTLSSNHNPTRMHSWLRTCMHACMHASLQDKSSADAAVSTRKNRRLKPRHSSMH